MFDKIILIFIALTCFSLVLRFIYKRYRDFESHIKKSLNEHDLIFISSKPSPLFKLSPFKKFKYKGVFYETAIFGFRGEDAFTRIVSFRDNYGKTHTSWVSIWTSAFITRDIEWELDLNEFNKKASKEIRRL